jgi:hypothetical protein
LQAALPWLSMKKEGGKGPLFRWPDPSVAVNIQAKTSRINMADSKPKLELQGLSVVAVGAFNPKIYHPLWFADNGLIRKEEASDSDIQILHHQVAVFSAPWFSLQATQERFQLETTDPTKFHLLRDLASSTFEILEHTPVERFGFNRNMHFRIDSEEDWHAFGDHFAPKQPWREILPSPGLSSMLISTRDTPESRKDRKKVTVRLEPSMKIEGGFGVYIQVNVDYKTNLENLAGDSIVGMKKNVPPPASQREKLRFFLETLAKQWDQFLTYSEGVPELLFSEFKKNEK